MIFSSFFHHFSVIYLTITLILYELRVWNCKDGYIYVRVEPFMSGLQTVHKPERYYWGRMANCLRTTNRYLSAFCANTENFQLSPYQFVECSPVFTTYFCSVCLKLTFSSVFSLPLTRYKFVVSLIVHNCLQTAHEQLASGSLCKRFANEYSPYYIY